MPATREMGEVAFITLDDKQRNVAQALLRDLSRS